MTRARTADAGRSAPCRVPAWARQRKTAPWPALAPGDRAALAATDARPRQCRWDLTPAALALSLTLMGCSSLTQTGADASSQGHLTMRVADAAMAAGAPEVALRVSDLILHDSPRNVPALIAKGDALYAMGHPDQARGAYSDAIAVDPAAVDALIGLGRTLVRSNPRLAEAAFLDAVTRQPANVTALSNLGIARDLQGHHDTAQAAYRQALAAAPDSADVKINLGLSLALSGKPAEAVALLQPLAREANATGLRRNDLAAALTLAGDRAEAQRVLHGAPVPVDGEAWPTDTASAETPLVAVVSPIRGRVAPPADATAPAGVATPAAVTTAAVTPSANLTVTPFAGVMSPADAAIVPSTDVTPRENVAVKPSADVTRPADVAGTASADAAPAAGVAVAPSADVAPSAHRRSSAPLTAAAAITPPLDIRNAPVVPVMEVASADAAIRPVEVAPRALAPPRAEVRLPAPRHDTGPVKLAAARIGKSPTPLHHPLAVDRHGSAPAAPKAPPASAQATGTITLAARAEPTLSSQPGERFCQLAALDSEQRARSEWQHLQTLMPELLSGHTPTIMSADVHGRTFWRLRTGGFYTANEQSLFCSQVHGLGLDCW